MSLAEPHDRLQLPAALKAQLYDYRRRVWTIKMVEATCVALFAVMGAFFVVFALDRLWDTPSALRLGVFVAALCGCAIVPWYFHRWVWRHRGLERLARLLSRKSPHVGDQLLGIIELARDETEQARSRTLCQAAIQTVAEDAQHRNLREAAPKSRHRVWSCIAVASIVAAVGLAVVFPSAAQNAWARLLAPWKATPRYTFAAVQSLPERMIVPHGEPITVAVGLAEESAWRPAEGRVQLGPQRPVTAPLRDGKYEFDLPPQIEPGPLHIRIGDSSQTVRIEPTLRPELSSVVANVSLPKYLERTEPLENDVRSGSISIVKGSRAKFAATANRKLASAKIDGDPQIPDDATITSPQTEVDGERKMEFEWQDEFGLAGKQPFLLTIAGRDDESPSLTCEDLPRRKVVLDTEQLGFQVKVHDDFGVKRVGMVWEGFENAVVKTPANGERILSAGGSDKVSLDIAGTFSADSLGIEPQPIKLRIFAEDYFPGRERVYSPTFVLFVLNAEQHAIWMTEQLSKWHRHSLEVRDREMQLYEGNKKLRDLPVAELDQPDTRRQIEKQAAAERANGRRLSNLAARGESLIKEASRNPEFGVGHLEKWAEMLQVLKDISANRMPSVADSLKDAAQAKQLASTQPAEKQTPKVGKDRAAASGASSEGTEEDPKKPPQAPKIADAESSQPPPADDQAPKVGKTRASASGSPSEGSEEDPKKPPQVPKIADAESSHQPLDNDDKQQASNSGKSNPRLTLPTITLLGGGPKDSQTCPVGEKMEEAVQKQEDLLAEFEKIANELNNILANLEGGTLVKRLKAASRLQYKIAGRIGDQIDGAFGRTPRRVGNNEKKIFKELGREGATSSQTVSLIMDDMAAYFARRRFMRFKTVLDDMKDQDVIGALRQLGDDIPKEHGLSIAQCEYWSDSLDRWAEDLVDPAQGGQ